MIRISVSDLESLRYWRASEQTDLADLVRRLRHAEEKTVAMEVGHAFAKFMEHAIDGTARSSVIVAPWTFDFSDLGDTAIELPEVRELKGEEVYETPSGPVTLVGKVDSIHGRRVFDQKLTSYWQAENYTDSLQWRAYLVMFKAFSFTYDVFEGKIDEARHVVDVRDYHRLTFYRYPGIEADVRRAVEDIAAVMANLPEAA